MVLLVFIIGGFYLLLQLNTPSEARATELYNKCSEAYNHPDLNNYNFTTNTYNYDIIINTCQETLNYFQANRDYINSHSTSGVWGNETIVWAKKIILSLNALKTGAYSKDPLATACVYNNKTGEI